MLDIVMHFLLNSEHSILRIVYHRERKIIFSGKESIGEHSSVIMAVKFPVIYRVPVS
jgi:hypothetical protein